MTSLPSMLNASGASLGRRASDDSFFGEDDLNKEEVMAANFEPSTWIVCCGVLEKKRDGAWREGWAKRFFVLGKHALYYYITAKTDRQGYTPLLGEERGQIRLSDLSDCKFIGQDKEHCFIQLDVKNVRKQTPSAVFQPSVFQVNLRTPVDSGQLWFNALKANCCAGGGGGLASSTAASAPQLLSSPTKPMLQQSSFSADASSLPPASKKSQRSAEGASLPPPPSTSTTTTAGVEEAAVAVVDFPLASPVPLVPFAVCLVAVWFIPHISYFAALLDLGLVLCLLEVKKREMSYNSLVRDAKLRLNLMANNNNNKSGGVTTTTNNNDNDDDEDKIQISSSGGGGAASDIDIGTRTPAAASAGGKRLHLAGSSMRHLPTAKPGQDYMAWSNGDAGLFKVRVGPNYKKLGLKAPSLDAMYNIVAVDLVKTKDNSRLNNVMGQQHSNRLSFAGVCTFDDLAQYQKAGVPKYFVVNSQVPNTSPSFFGGGGGSEEDAGYSLIMVFQCKSELLQSILQCAPPLPPAVKLLQDYCREHSTNPDIRRRFKAMGVVENLKDVGIPGVGSLIEKFQGKPAIINKVASIYDSPEENKLGWIEVDVSIFDFPYVAKKALYALKDRTAEIRLRAGFTLQGETDEELPECLLGAVDMCGLDFRLAKPID